MGKRRHPSLFTPRANIDSALHGSQEEGNRWESGFWGRSAPECSAINNQTNSRGAEYGTAFRHLFAGPEAALHPYPPKPVKKSSTAACLASRRLEGSSGAAHR